MSLSSWIVSFFILNLYSIGLAVVSARFLQSPCPDVFTYQMDTRTRAYFGRIELNDIQPGEIARLRVELSIGMQLPPKLVGSIALVKSRQATIEDIMDGKPALYRVNFPLPNLLPTVLSIDLNGQVICRGQRADARVLTAIKLEHTFFAPVQLSKPQRKGKTLEMDDSDTDLILRFEDQVQMQPATKFLNRPIFERSTMAPPYPSSAMTTCGRLSTTFMKKHILDGRLVNRQGAFPWNAPLFDRTRQHNPRYVCGSTIISSRHLLTAAHCVYEINEFIDPARLLAIPGMYNIDNFFEENAQFAYIEAIFPHDEYVPEEDLNDSDLAVLLLKKKLTFNDYVVPICPWQGENDLQRIVGQEGFLAGWGVTEQGVATVPTYIRSTIVSRRQCNRHLEGVYPSNGRIFCGDGQGSNPCKVDFGSGLALKRGEQYYLRGVVYRRMVDPETLRCDAAKYMVYIDIAPFRYWLKRVMG
ncbi:serine protease gd-like [Armigeres subalbatus]|uniref:serine protease gd-like n=1 Tax=Armigeres subalbatus TaxID=124917 RepID=UPI002ED39D9F